MAAKRKAGEVAGFDVVRAMKKAREGKGSAPPPPKKPPAPPAATPDQPDDDKKKQAKVGRTALPTKHIYVCYECGYEFTVAGKAHSLYCAKCRTILNQTDYTVSKRHDVAIKTAGAVTIEPEGIWKGKTLSARDVILKGRHESGDIKAFRRMEIHPGAEADYGHIDARLLVVTEGAEVEVDRNAPLRDVEVRGVLAGDIRVGGMLTIRPGGHVKGKLETQHITVEDGGGLTADVRIGQGEPEEEEPEPEPPATVKAPVLQAMDELPLDLPDEPKVKKRSRKKSDS